MTELERNDLGDKQWIRLVDLGVGCFIAGARMAGASIEPAGLEQLRETLTAQLAREVGPPTAEEAMVFALSTWCSGVEDAVKADPALQNQPEGWAMAETLRIMTQNIAAVCWPEIQVGGELQAMPPADEPFSRN